MIKLEYYFNSVNINAQNATLRDRKCLNLRVFSGKSYIQENILLKKDLINTISVEGKSISFCVHHALCLPISVPFGGDIFESQ